MSTVRLLLNKTPPRLLYEAFGVSTLISLRLAHWENARLPIVRTLFGIMTLVRWVQAKNALSPILLTLLPIVRLVRR